LKWITDVESDLTTTRATAIESVLNEDILADLPTQVVPAKYDVKLLMGLHQIRMKMLEHIHDPDSILESLLDIRRTSTNDTTNVLYAFVHYFLKHLVTKTTWGRGFTLQRIGNLFSEDDEAFAILVMINAWNEWEFLVSAPQRNLVTDKKNKKTRYTNCKVDKQPMEDDNETVRDSESGTCPSQCSGIKTTAKVRGWSREGLDMYNTITNEIGMLREQDDQVQLEEALLYFYQQLDTNKKNRSRRVNDESINAIRKNPEQYFGSATDGYKRKKKFKRAKV